MPGKVLAVVGAQYGSEGKGVIVNRIADRYQVHVRTGGPNAGHSFYDCNGRLWKMQVVPCGFASLRARVVLGRGIVINPRILKKEVEAILEHYDPKFLDRLIIDARCGVLSKEHEDEEGHTKGELHKRIGSTGEGVGAARLARLRRDPEHFKFAEEMVNDPEYGFLERCLVRDTPALLWEARNDGENILLEGTQGSGLSLIHGPWPFVTTADTNAAQLAADAGIPPQFVTNVLLVVRTYPIRVAGNSGPLKGETTWDEMSKRVGKPVIEQTTVTKKVRRVGEFDPELLWDAITLNGPTALAINFMDYKFPVDEGKDRWGVMSMEACEYVREMERTYGVPVAFLGTGGPRWSVVERVVAGTDEREVETLI